MLIQNITPAVIETWVQQRSREVGPASINSSLKTLRRALRMAVEWGLLVKAPKVKLVKGEHSREFVISEDLLKKMLVHEKCTYFLKGFIPFLIDTGLRISEALALEWEKHVGLEPKPGSKFGWVYVEKGKSKYAKRYVPLTKRAHDILKEQNKTVWKWVWPNENGEHLSRHWPSEQFRVLRDAMNLPQDCVIHSTRHTFCTRLGEAGCGAFEIQRLAGHSSVLISQKYVHPTPEILESAIDKMQNVGQKQQKKASGRTRKAKARVAESNTGATAQAVTA
jgi:integrase